MHMCMDGRDDDDDDEEVFFSIYREEGDERAKF